MIARCYDKKTREVAVAYEKATVCDEWLIFSNFLKFYNENHFDGGELDKDLLSGKSQHYSPETCCFLPKKINILLSFKKKKGDSPTGVTLNRRLGKFAARCQDGQNRKFLGHYGTEMEVHQAWQKEKIIQINLAIDSWLCEDTCNEKAAIALRDVVKRLQYELDNNLETTTYLGGK